jgi:hypothetical protein
MSAQSRSVPITTSTFANGNTNANCTSPSLLDTGGSNLSGAITGLTTSTARPVRITSFTIVYTNSGGTVYSKLSASVNGGDVWSGGTYTASAQTRTESPNLLWDAGSELWYGWRKLNSTTTRVFRSTSGGGCYFNGSLALNGRIRSVIDWITNPSAPGSFTSTAVTDSSVSFSWTAPGDDGGTGITGYRILYKTSAATSWTASGKLSTATTATISGLLPGTAYNFLVAATNNVTDGYNSTYELSTRVTGTNSAQVNVTTAVAGGNKAWNGTAFVLGKSKMWNGTAFVEKIPKIWNGSAWVDAK